MVWLRIRPNLTGLFCVLVTSTFGSLPANAQAPDYEFTSLVTAPGVAINSFNSPTSVPTINNSGVVAYRVRIAPFRSNLVLNDGTNTTTIDLNAAAGFIDIFDPSRPFINDSDAVVVSVRAASFGVPISGSVIRINPDTSVTTLATMNTDGVSGDFKVVDSALSMNNAGQVAAKVTNNSGVSSIVLLDDSGVTVIDTQSATRFNFTNVAINDAGVVAYKAQEPAPNGISVFTGDGISPVQKALPLPGGVDCGNTSAGPDINNNGLVAGQHPNCLFVGSGGVVTEVIVDEITNPFGSNTAAIGSLSLNDLDQIVFSASTTNNSTGSGGLYFGDDPVNDKLIDVGDSLFGETVGNPTGIPFCCGQPVRFAGEGGFNDHGQVVFLASTVSESNVATSYLIRADLQSPPDSDGDGVPDADDLCPGTALDAEVDEFGCSSEQLDTDDDGVSNAVDQCPGTAPGAQVDATGCSAEQRDSDEDGVSDALDQCPETAPGAVVDLFGCADVQVDADSDGVCDPDAASSGPAGCLGSDECADTKIPEAVPTASLLKNRYALTGSPNNRTFESRNKTVFTTENTSGCSCGQIIDALSLGGGHVLFGCSKSAMQEWSGQVQ